jgi:hypothetical protein
LATIIPLHRADEARREISRDVPSLPDGTAKSVALVNMPYAYLFRPTLTLSLLKALLGERKIPAQLLYPSFQFAELIGAELYFTLSTETPDRFTFAADWLFSGALFEQSAADQEAYLDEVIRPASFPEAFVDELLNARKHVDGFLDDCSRRVLADRPSAVVFTSVLQQQFPALALAKRLKTAAPDVLIAIAGTDWDGTMAAEIVRRFRFVDVAVSGEPDIVLPELVHRQFTGRSFDDLQGAYTAQNIEGRTTFPNAAVVRDLDALPFPDFDDFFEQLDASTVDGIEEPRIQF